MDTLLKRYDQVYLLYFWLRTNLKDFVPTKTNIRKDLYLEFGIEDETVIDEIYVLFHE